MIDASIYEIRSIAEAYESMVRDSMPFSTKKLDDMKYFKDRIDYCRKNLTYLGRGSSRMAFAMPNGHVLKLALNSKGLSQNQAECGDFYKNSYECFPTVYDTAGDYTWCEVEPARHCKTSDFPRLLDGITFTELRDLIVHITRERGSPYAFRRLAMSTPDERLNEIMDAVVDDPDGHPLLYGLYEFIGNYGATEMLVSDLFNVKNWGIVDRDGAEQLVIRDSGLNDDVWEHHYSAQRRR